MRVSVSLMSIILISWLSTPDDDTRGGHHTHGTLRHSLVTHPAQGHGSRPLLLCYFACCYWQPFLKAFHTCYDLRLLYYVMPTGVWFTCVISRLYPIKLVNSLVQLGMLHVYSVTIVANHDEQGASPESDVMCRVCGVPPLYHHHVVWGCIYGMFFMDLFRLLGY